MCRGGEVGQCEVRRAGWDLLPKTSPGPHSWAWNWGVEGGKNTPRKGGCQSLVLCILGEMLGKSSSALFLLL